MTKVAFAFLAYLLALSIALVLVAVGPHAAMSSVIHPQAVRMVAPEVCEHNGHVERVWSRSDDRAERYYVQCADGIIVTVAAV